MNKITKSVVVLIAAVQVFSVSAQSLEVGFVKPPMKYKPYVWWHWMGSNFSTEGITKDLEAMKEIGVGGATIFNITSAVQETHAPTLRNPWPEQTYRSPAYWKAVRFACQEAERLGLEIGLHNSVGYSTTGGPWIDEDKGMKHLVCREVRVTGGRRLTVDIPRPDLPPYRGWGASGKTVPDKYDEIAVLAVPTGQGSTDGKVVDLSNQYRQDGKIVWKAPKGIWTIFRIGYASTMACPHPVPDELIGKTLEVNKMDSAYTSFHWSQVLLPLKTHVGQYFGKSFQHLLIDSYEAGNQNWSRHFKTDFVRLKGYDPTPWLPFVVAAKQDTFLMDQVLISRFMYDFKDVIARLYQTNGWDIAHRQLNAMGLMLQQEPYTGPFSTVAGAASADLPMGEFWTNGSGMIDSRITAGARAAGRAVIGAEAFTSMPQNSMWTEDPAMLKKTTEGAFASGVNRLVLHQWVHQAFDDRYQPGMSMGWWGTHFSRFQPWLKYGKAYFDFVGRCQYLLQQGEQVIDFLNVGESADMVSDAIVTADFVRRPINVKDGDIILSSGRRYRIIQFQNTQAMLPEVLAKLELLAERGATIVALRPTSSPSLSGYPLSDDTVKQRAEKIWTEYAGKSIFASRNQAMKAIGLTPDYQILAGNPSVVHRHASEGEIYYVGNLTNQSQSVCLSLRISGMLPELWDAETGDMKTLGHWAMKDRRTVVHLDLLPYQSRFIVMRRLATTQEMAEGEMCKPAMEMTGSICMTGKWTVHFEPILDKTFDMKFDSLQDFSTNVDSRVKYFTGTATYQKSVRLSGKQLKSSSIILHLGEMNDIASLNINGEEVGVLWYPPYQMDITRHMRKGTNEIRIAVTNNWANRMIGDEQYPADFEWGSDRGVEKGRAMKAYPDWFLKGTPRPEQCRKTFSVWYYYRKDSQLQKAGLDGPVSVEFWNQKVEHQ